MEIIDPLDFLNGPVVEIAPRLLGCSLELTINGSVIRARIVETEAYDESDAASHSYKHKTERTRVMFGPAGHLYVYFTYGMHYCCNIVVGPEGYGAAVLIRAVEPLEGEDIMALGRPNHPGHDLTNGPAKLCQAFGIDKALNGHDLRQEPLKLIAEPALPATQIIQTTRVGINQAKDIKWRFYIKANPYVSKK
jgi:DNA-3-methyladenine glycosylase